MNIDLNKYTEFVNQVTSDESNYLKTMAARLYNIEATTVQKVFQLISVCY